MKPEFLMLAKVWKNQNIKGWMCSEKLDGTRAFCDGGITRGILVSEVPWANTIKDDRLKIAPVATGLWSRSGKVIHSPKWWTNQLPNFFIDGELWMGYGNFQSLRSEVASQDGDWSKVSYMAFGCPNKSVIEPRRITVRGDYKFEVKESDQFLNIGHLAAPITWGFENEIKRLESIGPNDVIQVVKQEEIPYQDTGLFIAHKLQSVLNNGGEGLMFRHQAMPWEACRSKFLLKHKPFFDCEVKITGYTSGKLTDKGSKHLGKIGALITEFQGKRLLVSGLTDIERELGDSISITKAIEYPGQELPGAIAKHFKVGQIITIRYRELSDDKIPKEARFWRKHSSFEIRGS